MSSVENHAFTAKDFAWYVQTIKHEPWFSQKNCTLNLDAYLNGCVFKREVTIGVWREASKWWDGTSF